MGKVISCLGLNKKFGEDDEKIEAKNSFKLKADDDVLDVTRASK